MTATVESLKEVLIPHAECGNEKEYSKMMAKKLSRYTGSGNVKVDVLNNVVGFIGDQSKYTIMLEAHIDEISLIVAFISDDGFLRVRNVGGVDRRTLLSSEVVVNGLNGIVCSTPPHLAKDNTSVPKYADLYIDLGLSAEEVKKRVKVGDRIYFQAPVTELMNGKIASRALDNKVCAYTILTALKKLEKHIQENSLDCCIAILFAAQEEVGSRGATVGTYSINPDEALVLDVTLATQTGYKNDITLGGGAVIERSAYFDRDMVRDLVSAAKRKELKFQSDVSARSTGTDAAAVHTSCCGVSTVLISMPLRYMHTPVEVVDIADVENTAELIAEYIITKFAKSDIKEV